MPTVLTGLKISSGSLSNMLSILSSLLKAMLFSTRLYSLGPIVRVHRLYPGLYKHNHHPEYRSSVEHFFGFLKLSLPPILDLLPSIILIQYPLQPSNLLQLQIAPTTLLTREKKFLDMLLVKVHEILICIANTYNFNNKLSKTRD
ncbi:MAG: hypothetical protein ACTSYD_13770 [Candidatus Heimdallarchaeaceae archaeon]